MSRKIPLRVCRGKWYTHLRSANSADCRTYLILLGEPADQSTSSSSLHAMLNIITRLAPYGACDVSNASKVPLTGRLPTRCSS
jgi:hypothetical protein